MVGITRDWSGMVGKNQKVESKKQKSKEMTDGRWKQKDPARGAICRMEVKIFLTTTNYDWPRLTTTNYDSRMKKGWEKTLSERRVNSGNSILLEITRGGST